MHHPQTIDEAAERLLAELNEEQKAALQAIPRDHLLATHFSLGLYVRNTYGLWEADCPLMRDFIDPDEASAGVIERAWELLQG